MTVLLSLCLGVALAAACGLRVFLPLLLVSIAGQLGWVQLTGSFAWIASTPAVITFAVALVVEVAAFYVPWLDHLLDAAAAPLAVAAGILISAAVMTGMDPLPRWTLAIVAGGGAAAGMHAASAALRLVSSATTGGLANFVVATGELLLSGLLSALALALPLVAVAATGILLLILTIGGLRRREA